MDPVSRFLSAAESRSSSERERLLQAVQLAERAQHLANDVLLWIGFGTVVGLVAKAIMPGRDPGGAVATAGLLHGLGQDEDDEGYGHRHYYSGLGHAPRSRG